MTGGTWPLAGWTHTGHAYPGPSLCHRQTHTHWRDLLMHFLPRKELLSALGSLISFGMKNDKSELDQPLQASSDCGINTLCVYLAESWRGSQNPARVQGEGHGVDMRAAARAGLQGRKQGQWLGKGGTPEYTQQNCSQGLPSGHRQSCYLCLCQAQPK